MRYILRTPRLTLRPVGPEDLETTHDYSGCEENARYMLFLPYKSIEETANFLTQAAAWWDEENPEAYEFAIILGEKHVGGITLEMVDREAGVGELGWIVHRDYWGQGIVTEAAREILRFAKEDCGIKKLVAHCDCRNIPSRGAMEKLGLRFDHISGVRYDHQTKEPVDEYYYQMDL